MLAVPPALLDILHLQPGAKVGIAIERGRLVVEPRQRQRRRYTLNELLAQCNPKAPRGRKERERRRAHLMERGEICLVSLDPSSGHEQKGRRSVLIVSPEAFNRITKLPIILLIASGGNFARTAGFAVPLTGAGAKTTGVVRCDQPRALDLAARGGKKLETVPDAIMDEVLAKISPIFE